MTESAIPGPKGLPLVGWLFSFARDPIGFLSESARRYGDFVVFNVAGQPNLLLTNPDLIEQILVKDSANFPKDRQFWRHVTAVFGSGLLTSRGTLWQRQRKLAAPAFSNRALPDYAEVMVEESKAMLARWRHGEIRDLHADMMGLTLRIAARTLFGADLEEDVAMIESALDALVTEVASRIKRPVLIPDWVPLPGHLRYNRSLRRIETVVTRMIAARRAQPRAARDLLSHLLEARDEAGAPMSDRQLRDEVVTVLLAGHETTAIALSWTLHLLSRHPEIQSGLAMEARAVLDRRPAGIEDVERLRLSTNVVTESMRLFPPAWVFGREPASDCTLGGHRIAAGTPIYISAFILHRDPHFYEAPDEFRPERWEGSLAQDLPRFAYMPFGGGPRICIGKSFAMIEAVLILATLLRDVTVTAVPGREPKPFPSITLRPQGGVWARIAQRP